VSSRLRHGKRLPLVAAEVSAPDGAVSQPGPRAAWLLSASLFVPLRTNEPKFVARGERDIRTRRPSRFAKTEFCATVWPASQFGRIPIQELSMPRPFLRHAAANVRQSAGHGGTRLPLWT